ncbi:hypothetical protein [Sinomonas sp. P10A9]|uniref:Uncharacterized protein n=1 Tax=Sinomonas puerhi TaxID=3238584 RepID=A0AB39L2W8_9MICC
MPRLTGAQLDAFEERVEREVSAIEAARADEAASYGAVPRGAVSRGPEASWLRRAAGAVVRGWRSAAEREAGLDAERDEVRRRLLMDQSRLW